MPRLRDGSETQDVRLDRLVEFDERSRQYPARALLSTPRERQGPRSRAYRVGKWLDQGDDGACVGFAWTHEMAASPTRLRSWRALDDDFAFRVYCEAQGRDQWAGGSRRCGHGQPWYEGTSVLAGAKVLQDLGYLSEYRWAFGEDDLAMAISYLGPAVIGVPWYDGMFQPNAHGFLEPTGRVQGGHAVLVASLTLRHLNAYRIWNSWGRGWGHMNGWAYISREHMARLLSENGEACIPLARARVSA